MQKHRVSVAFQDCERAAFHSKFLPWKLLCIHLKNFQNRFGKKTKVLGKTRFTQHFLDPVGKKVILPSKKHWIRNSFDKKNPEKSTFTHFPSLDKKQPKHCTVHKNYMARRIGPSFWARWIYYYLFVMLMNLIGFVIENLSYNWSISTYKNLNTNAVGIFHCIKLT